MPVADIILGHQERTDGSGYPRGLIGETIIFESRILAVAAVVEAMMSHRPYPIFFDGGPEKLPPDPQYRRGSGRIHHCGCINLGGCRLKRKR